MFDWLEMASWMNSDSSSLETSSGSSPSPGSSEEKMPKTEEKPLILNPADLLVDESLPSPPVTSNVGSLFGKQATDEEVRESLPLRTAARKTVVDKLKNLQSDEKNKKSDISNRWNSSSPKQQEALQAELNNYKLPEYIDLIDYVKGELVWWNTNVRISTTTVNTRAVNFIENLQTKTDIYLRTLQQNIDTLQERQRTNENATANKKAEIMNRTIWDITREAITKVFSYIGIIIYIVFGLTFASFVANSFLHKPVLYRILAFVYAFIFAPIFGVYYTYNRIKYAIGIQGANIPKMEGFLPLKSYVLLQENSEPTLIQRLFGYPKEKTEEFIKSQATKELNSLEKAVENTSEIFGKIVEERKKA